MGRLADDGELQLLSNFTRIEKIQTNCNTFRLIGKRGQQSDK